MSASDLLHLLEQRRSTPVASLGEPGPDPLQLQRIVATALRVPDHGKLTPWRLLSVDAAQRAQVAHWLAERHREIDPTVAESALEKDRKRFGDSPCWLVAIASIASTDRIPEQEQLLSAGCVCFSLLLAAQAIGFGAQWLTGWAAYDPGVRDYFGLAAHERIIGFVHIGRIVAAAPERARPTASDKLSRFVPA